MNATKRKFNSLIQGLGTRPSSPRQSSELDERGESLQKSHLPSSSFSPSSSPSLSRTADALSPKGSTITNINASSPANNDPTKRRRVGVFGSATENENNAPSTSPLAASKVILIRGKRPTGDGSVAPEPKFCPSDRDQLIRRLATFQELTEWTPKPDKLNEIEWARRGWVCQGKERVRCTLCNKELVVQTNGRREAAGNEAGPVSMSVPMRVTVTVDPEVQEAMVNKFAGLILEAHQEDCLWRRRACDESLLRLPLSNPQAALSSLRQRYDDLSTRPSFLPYLFNLRLPDGLDLQTAKSQLPTDFFTDPPPPSTVGSATTPTDVALALSLTGWQGLTNPRIGPVPNSASCATCLRRLGLWMFKSREADEATGQVIVPAPMDHLDPVREHRFFCPWRNPSVQKNPASKVKESKAGWEVLAETLKNTAYLRKQAEKSSRSRLFHRSSASVPVTPSKGAKGTNKSGGNGAGGDQQREEDQVEPPTPDIDSVSGLDEEEDLAVREAKDKERWARLRRVKSLFDTKNGKRLKRTLSRPSSTAPASRPTTAHGEEAGSAEGNEAANRT